jgi:hypothetical protein
MLIGKVSYGSWNDGSDIFKDSKGYYVVQYNPQKEEEYKKYLPRWKPVKNTVKLCLKNKKWKRCTKTRRGRK